MSISVSPSKEWEFHMMEQNSGNGPVRLPEKTVNVDVDLL